MRAMLRNMRRSSTSAAGVERSERCKAVAFNRDSLRAPSAPAHRAEVRM
jgi:hypothetical protein